MFFLLALLLSSQNQPNAVVAGKATLADSHRAASGFTIRCSARDGLVSRQVQVAADGAFECAVPAGVYLLEAEPPKGETRYHSQPYRDNNSADDGSPIRVRAGERADVAFAIVPSGSIAGRVLHPNGELLAGTTVNAVFFPEDNDGVIGRTEQTYISTDGTFTLAGLEPGVYRLFVAPPPSSSDHDDNGNRLMRTWYRSTTDVRYALPVHVNGDEVEGIDLVLVSGKPVSLRGRVLRASSGPASGVRIGLMMGGPRSLYVLGAATNDKGEFTLPAVAPGEYELVAEARDDPSERSYQRIVIDDADPEVVLMLRSATHVRGRVGFEGGEFPAEPRLHIAANGFERLVIPSQAAIDDDGRFELQKAVGKRILRPVALPRGWWLKSVTAGGRNITNEIVDVGDGLDNVEIVISRSMGSIVGRIEVESSLPVETAVVVFSDDSAQWVRSSTAIRRVWPGDDGTFAVEGLSPGRYRVIAVDRPPGNARLETPDALLPLRPRAALVEVGEKEVVEVKIPLVRMADR